MEVKKRSVWVLRDHANVNSTTDDIKVIFYNKPTYTDLLNVLKDHRGITDELLDVVYELVRVVNSPPLQIQDYFSLNGTHRYGIHHYTMIVND